MNGRKLGMFLLSITFLSPLTCVYISLMTYTRVMEDQQIQQVIVLGYKPLCPDCNKNEYKQENEHASLMQESIKLIASGSIPVAFVIDCPTEGAQLYLNSLVELDQETTIHVSLTVKMALLFDKYATYYKNIDFFYADRRGKPIIALLQAIDILNQTLGLIKVQKNRYMIDLDGDENYFKQQDIIKRKLLESSYASFIKKRFFSLTSEVTVGKFIKKIDKISKKIPREIRLGTIRINMFCAYARSFVQDYAADIPLKQVVWDTFQQEKSQHFHRHIKSWIIPLSNFILDDGMQRCFEKMITKYRRIVFSCNHNHAVWLKGFFDGHGFFPCQVAGTLHIAKKHSRPLPKEIVQRSMGVVANNVGATRIMQCCNSCMKTEAANEQFDRCSKCKTTYYCSRECQARNWPTHKIVCKRFIEQTIQDQKGYDRVS